jgi:hypothetical protein
MQRFSGEDLMKEERTRQQRAEMVSTIEQQKYEKAIIARQSKGDGDQAIAEITALRNEIEANEVNLRKELQRKQFDDNMFQAEDNLQRKNALLQANMEANQKELDHHSGCNFLNEQAPSHFNNRVIRAQYKGSSREEKVKVAAEVRQQAMEAEMKKHYDKQQDRGSANTVENTRKALVGMERDKQRRAKELRDQNMLDNRKLQEEQRANRKHFDKMYKNAYSPEFFEQFGTGCR